MILSKLRIIHHLLSLTSSLLLKNQKNKNLYQLISTISQTKIIMLQNTLQRNSFITMSPSSPWKLNSLFPQFHLGKLIQSTKLQRSLTTSTNPYKSNPTTSTTWRVSHAIFFMLKNKLSTFSWKSSIISSMICWTCRSITATKIPPWVPTSIKIKYNPSFMGWSRSKSQTNLKLIHFWRELRKLRILSLPLLIKLIKKSKLSKKILSINCLPHFFWMSASRKNKKIEFRMSMSFKKKGNKVTRKNKFTLCFT